MAPAHRVMCRKHGTDTWCIETALQGDSSWGVLDAFSQSWGRKGAILGCASGDVAPNFESNWSMSSWGKDQGEQLLPV